MLAVIVATDDPERLRVAFSLAVSTAVEGEPTHVLLTLGALPATVADAVDADLWATVEETGVAVYACHPGPFEVTSMPRFLQRTAGARLVVV